MRFVRFELGRKARGLRFFLAVAARPRHFRTFWYHRFQGAATPAQPLWGYAGVLMLDVSWPAALAITAVAFTWRRQVSRREDYATGMFGDVYAGLLDGGLTGSFYRCTGHQTPGRHFHRSCDLFRGIYWKVAPP